MSIIRSGWTLGCVAVLVLTSACNLGAGRNEQAERNQAKGGGLAGLMGGSGNQQQQNAAREAAPTPPDVNDSRSEEPATTNTTTPITDKPTGGPAQGTAARDNFDRRMRIVNDSDQRITLVQGSPVSESNWGADRIPTTTIAEGESVIVDFNDNNGECRYDLRVTFANSETAERRGVNICEASEWRAAPGGGNVR